jgi:hypothetical protein
MRVGATTASGKWNDRDISFRSSCVGIAQIPTAPVLLTSHPFTIFAVTRLPEGKRMSKV